MSAQTAVTSRVIENRLQTARVVELFEMGALIDPALEALRLQRILHPATDEQILMTLNKLFRQFAVTPPSDPEDRKELNRGYLLAMQGYPIWSVIEAGTNFIRGSVEGHNPDFMPKPGTIGRELARIVDGWRMKLGRAQKQADEKRALEREETGYGPLSPEARALGERRISELRAAALAERQQGQSILPGYVDPNPITAEALEAAGVPDAPPRTNTGTFEKLPDPFQMLKAS